ncbi:MULTISPECIES: ABC transporter permease [Chitinophagaceae]
MNKNFIKTVWRNLKRNWTFSILNIAGLAIGVACAALIFLWVEFYVNFNKPVKNLDNLYNVKNTQTYGKDKYTFSATAFLTKDLLEARLPGIAGVSRYRDLAATLSADKKYLSQSGAYVDPAFMTMFGFATIAGNANKALEKDAQIAISEKLAKVYFDGENAMSKTIMVDNKPYTVAAIYKNREKNVSFQNVDFLLPMNVFYSPHKGKEEDSWGNNWTDTWVLLNANANADNLNRQLKALVKKTYPETNNEVFLYPLKRMTLYGSFTNGVEDTSLGMIRYVNMFSLIALVILMIACINFMNLSTARSERRAKEIGVRKVLGSSRKELIGKLLIESVIIAYVAVAFAVILVALVLPLFSGLIAIPLEMGLSDPVHLLFLIVIGLVAGIVAGSYPALYLSSFNPIAALKRQSHKIGGGVVHIRKVLVVVQFTVSIVIIFAVIIIYQQILYTKNRELGFNKNNVLSIGMTEQLQKNFASLRQNILNTNVVEDVTESNASPMNMYSNGGGFRWKGKDENDNILITIVGTDNHFNKTFGIELKDGHGFSETVQQDSANVIINETLAELMGKEGHIGAQIRQGDGPVLTVTGIMKNFVYNNMSQLKPDPLIMYHAPSWASQIYIRLKPTSSVQASLTKLEPVFKNADPTKPFDYQFLDDSFNRKFQQIRFIGTLSTLFGELAIFISCLGLFGLSAFMAEQRTKEIGVRKVLGASVTSVISLLSKDFLKLVGVACLIAFPFAYWLMHSWLQDYQYRIDIGWYVYVLAGIVALTIAFLTIYFQTFRAATANPVKSLRTE